MRFYIGFLSLTVAGALIAQVASYENVASTKEIMTTMAIPASNALFAAPDKPSDQEWADLRKNALILAEAGNLLMIPGRSTHGNINAHSKAKTSTTNPPAWNQAAKAMRDSGRMAMNAIEKKDTDMLAGDVAEKILASCSSCHDKYMIK